MLLYSSDDERNKVAVNYINNRLRVDITAFMRLSMQMIVKVALVFQIYPLKLMIIKKILKVVNFKLLILSLIMNQHYMEIYPFNKLKVELGKTISKNREKKILYNNYY
jgi:hypothetical protein